MKIRFRRIKIENDRLEELKREFKEWKQNQKKKQIKYDDDHLELYCYITPIVIIFLGIFMLWISFFIL